MDLYSNELLERKDILNYDSLIKLIHTVYCTPHELYSTFNNEFYLPNSRTKVTLFRAKVVSSFY